MSEPTSTPEKKAQPTEVKFDYLKSNLFRVIRIDGAFGGISPQGQIWMTFFSERGAIPTQVVQAVTDEGTLGKEIVERRAVRDAFVREAEVVGILSLETARSIRKWLNDKIDTLEKAQAEIQNQKDAAAPSASPEK